MTFYAREVDSDFLTEPFQSKNGAEVRAWLRQRLALTTDENNIEWRPVIMVVRDGESEHQYREQEERSAESVGITIDRFWFGLTRDEQEWRALRWVQGAAESAVCVPENERYAASTKHGLGPKNPRLRDYPNEKPFRLPSYEERYRSVVAYLDYTPELWAGLHIIVRTIANSRKALDDLIRTKRGVATLAAVGAGQQPLQLLPPPKAAV
jgi:hypothetical protein